MQNTPPSSSGAWFRATGILFLVLLPLVTLIPVTPVPAWLTQDLVLRWAAILALLLCGVGFFKSSPKNYVLELDLPDLLILALAGWVLLSVHNSQETFDSFYALHSFLAMVLWWFCLRLVARKWEDFYPAFEKVFFFTAVAAAAWLFISTAGRWIWFSFFVRFIPRQGLFPNSNIAAGFLGLALLWCFLRFLHGKKMNLPGLAVIFLGWGLTQSRGALVAMVLVVVLYLVLHMKEIETVLSGWTTRQWSLFFGVVIFAAVALFAMVDRFFHAMDMDPRAFLRLDVWISGLQMAQAQPLLGFGPGTFGDVYPAFRSGSLWNTITPFAHNEYLQVAAECGLPTLGLLLLLIWTFLAQTGQNLWRIRTFQSADRVWEWKEYAFFLLLFEAIHNFVDFTFHEWSHRFVLMAFLALALRDGRPAQDLKTSFHFSKRACWAVSVIFALSILWILGIGGLRDYRARLFDFYGNILQQQGQWDQAGLWEQKSISIRPTYMNAWNSLGAIEDFKAGASSSAKEREQHEQAAEDDFREAIRLSPYSPTPRENEIQVMLKRDRFAEALDLEDQLIQKAPEMPTAYLTKAQILLAVGRAKDAIAPAQKCIDLDNFFLPGYLIKAKAMLALGKKNDALQVYQQAQQMLKSLNIPDPSGQVDSSIESLENDD